MRVLFLEFDTEHDWAVASLGPAFLAAYIRQHGHDAAFLRIPVDQPVADIIDLCLLMSVNPGWGGQRYIGASTARLAGLRGLLPPEVVLEVDGGISLATIDEARDAGAQLFVAGSSVFGASDPAQAFKALAARL